MNWSKGAKELEEWGPLDAGCWCQYAVDWTEVKAQRGLTMTQAEAVVEVRAARPPKSAEATKEQEYSSTV